MTHRPVQHPGASALADADGKKTAIAAPCQQTPDVTAQARLVPRRRAAADEDIEALFDNLPV